MDRLKHRVLRTLGPALLLTLAAGTASAQSTFTYQWYCDNNWNDSCPTTINCPAPKTVYNTNWRLGTCSGNGTWPTIADDVIISPMDASKYLVNLGVGGSCNTISTALGSVLVIDGGNLVLGSAGSIAGSLMWGNGSISSSTGSVPVMITGDVSMYPPYNHLISHLAVDSFGTVTWTGGNW